MLKRRKHRNEATAWRCLSISQVDLAKYLGISVSLLSMYDKGLRELPSKASLKLTRLQADYVKQEQANTMGRSFLAIQTEFEEQQEKAAEKMQERVELSRYKKKQAKDKLNELTEKQEQDKIWINVLEQKLQTLTPGEAKEPDGSYLNSLHDKILQRLKRTNKEKLKLQLEIELMEAASLVYEAHHLRLKKKE